jgi:fatty-acyl-CoA synthase
MTQMLEGLMQDDFPLTLNHLLRRLRSYNQGAEVVTLLPDGSSQRATHAQVAERVDRLARALGTLGVEQGRAWARCCTRSTFACSRSS